MGSSGDDGRGGGGGRNGLSNGVLQEGVVCMGKSSGGVIRTVQVW